MEACRGCEVALLSGSMGFRELTAWALLRYFWRASDGVEGCLIVCILPMKRGILLRRWEVWSRTLLSLQLMAELPPTNCRSNAWGYAG